MQEIRFGANFIPSKNWLHSWVDWDAVSIEEDLVASKELGIDHIRAHLMWPYFQIDPYVMSSVCLKNLESFRNICEKVNIDYHISLFTGFMSGMFFYPAWQKKLTGNFGEGIFTHTEMIKTEEYYMREVAKVVADSPNFLGFDLGNELSCIALYDKTMTFADGDRWNNRMLALCEELAPGKLHNNGVDHMPWFSNIGFSAANLANTGAITPLHCYSVFTGALERFGRMSTESLHLAPFMAELAKAYCDDQNRLYWIQEFGTASDILDDEMIAFIKGSMDAMFTQKNLWGITWWCTHNIARNFSSFDKIEYELGLLDNNNRPTALGKLFSDIVKKYKAAPIVPPERKCAFILKENNLNEKPADTRWENGHRYAQYVEQGIYPAIILAEKADDAEYLKARGIEKILD